MNAPSPLEWMHARVIIAHDRLCVAAAVDDQMNDASEAFIGYRDDGRVRPRDRGDDRIETAEVDRFAADFDEVAKTAFDAQDSALDRTEVLRHEPAVHLRIDEPIRGAVSGQERLAAQRQPSVVSTDIEMVQHDQFWRVDGRGRYLGRALRHSIARQ